MSNLINLKGAKVLTKKEQQSINGGLACHINMPCPGDLYCDYRWGDGGLCQSN